MWKKEVTLFHAAPEGSTETEEISWREAYFPPGE